MISFDDVKNKWDIWYNTNNPKVSNLYQFNEVLPNLLYKRYETIAYIHELELFVIILKAKIKKNKRNGIDILDDKLLFDKYFEHIKFIRSNIYIIDEMIKRIMARLKIEDYKRKHH